MVVLCEHRIVEELIRHDRTCVEHRIIEPKKALQEMYDQSIV